MHVCCNHLNLSTFIINLTSIILLSFIRLIHLVCVFKNNEPKNHQLSKVLCTHILYYLHYK